MSTQGRADAEHIRKTLRRLARQAYLTGRTLMASTLLERRIGISTARVEKLEGMGLASEGRLGYEPSGWLDLRRTLSAREVASSDVFLDLGSGKGRVLLEAARYPFRRILGVEVSEQLNLTARANVQAAGHRLLCHDITITTADIARFDVPDDVTVIYLYNSFRGDVFEAAIRKIIDSFDRRPRAIRLIYKTPMEEQRLIATGRFKLVRCVRGLRPGRRWSQKMSIRTYVVEPPGAAVGAIPPYPSEVTGS